MGDLFLLVLFHVVPSVTLILPALGCCCGWANCCCWPLNPDCLLTLVCSGSSLLAASSSSWSRRGRSPAALEASLEAENSAMAL